jgi:hypothetical protein
LSTHLEDDETVRFSAENRQSFGTMLDGGFRLFLNDENGHDDEAIESCMTASLIEGDNTGELSVLQLDTSPIN